MRRSAAIGRNPESGSIGLDQERSASRQPSSSGMASMSAGSEMIASRSRLGSVAISPRRDGAGHAELLLSALEEDLAVEETVIKVLAGRIVEAEFAIAADLHANPPAGFGEVHPTLRE